jgi:hypothetical protein
MACRARDIFDFSQAKFSAVHNDTGFELGSGFSPFPLLKKFRHQPPPHGYCSVVSRMLQVSKATIVGDVLGLSIEVRAHIDMRHEKRFERLPF